MKIQIEPAQLRFRLDRAEFAALLAAQPLQARWPLAPEQTLRVTVQATTAAEPVWQATALNWQLQLPAAELAALAARLPCRDGLSWRIDCGGTPLCLSLDVDIHDGRGRRSAP